ncbi:bifunctional DNA-formamidopyrimidine glycosylase/DNA-(apurinic or apyrimidinic site) lyase [soil metagenome]
MPELPEVETTRRGIVKQLLQQTITKVIVRNARLRWPVANTIYQLEGQTIYKVTRRGKYLIISVHSVSPSTRGHLLIHLGMSGHVRIIPATLPVNKHEHIDIVLNNGFCLRYTDPRRFGSFIWTVENPLQHTLLAKLGPEPLSASFNTSYLFDRSRSTQRAIKLFIMDSQIVVGVGNIYANEALFAAGIHPQIPANELTEKYYQQLVLSIKQILRAAIAKGGTTLRDFHDSEGKPGYFQQVLQVYGRGGEPCRKCNTNLSEIRLGQRSTVYCAQCQKVNCDSMPKRDVSF